MKSIQGYLKITIAIFLANILSSHIVDAQTKTRELYLTGIGITDLQFGLQYKASPNGKIFFRYSFINFETSYNKHTPSSTTIFPSSDFHTHLGLEAGIEIRKNINQRMVIYTGLNLIAEGDFMREKSDNPLLPAEFREMDRYTISPGLGLNSGVILNLGSGLMLSAEIAPKILMNFILIEDQVDPDNKTFTRYTTFDMLLNTQSVSISIIYQWNKETE